MIKLYLIRHGETAWNKEHRWQGWTDIELSEEGIKQAELLGERFKNFQIDEIYSSPLKRAYETARPAAEKMGLEIVKMDNFKEINFGYWEGKDSKELTAEYGEEFTKFMSDPENMPFPGDGSFANVEKRVMEGINKILEGKNGKSIAVVSHGGIVRIIIKALLGIEGEWFNKTWIDNTSISLIEIHKNYNLLRVLNDFSHLKNGIF